MDIVIRALVTYVFVWLIMRVAGKRSLAEITTFDFVLLLIISETTQNALTDRDNSMTAAALLILTMVGLDVALSLVERHWPHAETVIEGTPLVIVDNGEVIKDRTWKSRVGDGDILSAARQQGLERLDQIKYAVLERNGAITVVKKEPG
jgi:uncharacterized membrane protein YcaP (DUF421 family)